MDITEQQLICAWEKANKEAFVTMMLLDPYFTKDSRENEGENTFALKAFSALGEKRLVGKAFAFDYHGHRCHIAAACGDGYSGMFVGCQQLCIVPFELLETLKVDNRAQQTAVFGVSKSVETLEHISGKGNELLIIDPCYFKNAGDINDPKSFYHKACNAGGKNRGVAVAHSFQYCGTTCCVAKTLHGDGVYYGCSVDSGQLCLIPLKLASKLRVSVASEHYITTLRSCGIKLLESICKLEAVNG